MNKRLTLPVYYTLKHGSQDQRDALLVVANRGREATLEEKQQAASAMVNSGAYDFCRSLVNKYSTKCKAILHESFPKNQERNLLSSAIRVIRTNKYLAHLRKLKQGGENVPSDSS
jgi:geranylgeranyl pyrophosphate synthase